MLIVSLYNPTRSPHGVPIIGGGHVVVAPGQKRDDVSLSQGDFDALHGGPLVASMADEGAPQATATGYAVVDKGRGWFVITKDGEDVTKSLRADDVDGFDGLTAEDQAAYVEQNKPADD